MYIYIFQCIDYMMVNQSKSKERKLLFPNKLIKMEAVIIFTLH